MTIALFALCGALLALPVRALAGKLVRTREAGAERGRMFCGKHAVPVWIAVSALGPALIAAALPAAGMVRLIQYALVFFVILCLSAVDVTVRRIPNVLLALLVAIFLVGDAVTGGFTNLKSGLLGAVIAVAVFIIPSKMGLNIGWGDVKYAAVIGLCFGLAGFLQVTLVMALALAAYAAYLRATKKGNLYSSAAMGPYLSLGVMTAMVFPVLQNVISL